MGKITKTAGARHEATLSPALSDFIKTTVSIPLYQLPSHLAQLPRLWPFPRGDLYHWIPVLNRFDRILELFVNEYGMKNGPQTQPFERRLLLRGDAEDGGAAAAPAASHEVLDQNFQADGDRQLVESILRFTKLLLENCGNRSLYASSGHLNHLINTTSLSLLKVALRLCLRLAQRYHASRQRMASMGQHHINLLSNHYNISLEKVQKLSLPFVRTSPPSATTFATPNARGKDKSTPLGPRRGNTASKVHGADMVSIIREADVDSVWEEWGGVSLSYYESQTASGDHAEGPRPGNGDAVSAPPVTPTPIRRTSSLGAQQTPRFSRPTAAEESLTPQGTNGRQEPEPRADGPRIVEIPASELLTTPEHELLKSRTSELPEDARYELLQKIRVAKALSSGKRSRADIVAVRMLAVANLAYIYPDAIFQQKIAQPDSEEPRRLQLASQLSELVYPSGEEAPGEIQDLHTIALCTLEALTKQRSKATDVFNALNANVNHGILFYIMRKAVGQLPTEDDHLEVPTEEDEWRDALFSLLNSLPTSTARAGEQMVSAGLFDILVDFLTVRTEKAERDHPKVLNFLDSFVYNVRDAFQSLVNAKGLDVISDLTAYEVATSFAAAEQGKGMPDSYKTQLTDYRIPFHRQQTLRALFKFLTHMMSHSGNNHDRLLRNLIDSPQLLGALRRIIAHGRTYGSNVWSSAVNILSSFIHNEPTSYAVIAEAGLSRGFLEAVSQKWLADVEASSDITNDNNVPTGDRESDVTIEEHKDLDASNRAATLPSLSDRNGPLAQGILPSAEAIMAVPQAFGAICLNEAGMKLFQRSGALDSFFEIFESPEHVKVLDTDSDVPTALGNSFDELVRHHPPLKNSVLKAVEEMVVCVGRFCLNRVISKGVGAKLWKEGKDGQIFVAGGRRALLGEEEPLLQKNERRSHGTKAAQGDDVHMQDADRSASPPTSAPQEVSIEQVVDDEDSSEGPTTSQYINVACKFLNGFFSNTALCSAFVEAGGLEWVLDFATLSCLPYNFQQKMGVADEFSRLIHQLVEQKPHLTLPSLLKRMQTAIDVLAPLSAHTGDSAFFSPFTDLERAPRDGAEGFESRLENGTKYAKALVIVHTLCNALALTFQSQMYNHRASNNVFSQVNLADMYCRLVESLGHLQRSCIWEEILLLKNMPSEIKAATTIPSTADGFGSDEADEVLGIPHVEPPPPSSRNTSTTSDSINGTLNSASDGAQSSARVNGNTVQFKNIRTLRYLLSQLPAAITPLFQAVGKNLLFRRSIEPYQKQKAVAVAGQLAAAAIEQLRFEGAKKDSSANDRYSYWIVVLTSISQLMMDEALDRNSPQTLTLVLQSFKAQGGLDTLGDILETFFDDAKDVVPAQAEQDLSAEAKSRLNLILGGIKIILTLYSRITNAKYVVDAVQTTAMQSRSDRDRDKADFFSTAQFLVELRMAVIKPVQKLWYSDALMDKATTSIVKTVIDILKIVLEGESESGAFKRSDKVPRPTRAPLEKWKVRRPEQFVRLSEEYGEDLAREALYRCYDSMTLAREYCSIHKNDPRSTRNPIPPEEDPTRVNSQGSSTPATGDAAAHDRSPEINSTTEEQSLSASLPLMMQGIQTGDTRSEWPPVLSSAEEMLSSLLGEDFGDVIHGLGHATETPSSSNRENGIEASKLPGVVTVEDLDEERANLRSDLIDRSLNVLNVHDDVSFDLQELISSAVTKAPESAAMRAEVGSTLIQSLISLQMEEDFRPQGKKIAAYANLLALIIQDKDFYEAIRDELKDNLPTMLGFIKVFSNQQPEETSPWIGHILAVFERPLSEDAQPVQITWIPPRDDAPQDVSPLPEPPEPVVPHEVKVQLFEAIIDILPRIGKDENLALAVVRVLVILTRDRQVSTRLGQKRNIQRLFLMIKQLAGNTNDKLQSAFMSVLRNIIEDEEIIRQIMRTEIQAMFDGRSQRQTDTTGYTRQMYQHVLRAPEIFVEVTSEKLKLARFDGNQRPQILTMKKDEEPVSRSSNDREDNPETEDASQAATDVDKAKPSTEPEGKNESEKPKVSELKPPVVENPDGVIHYLLCELLAYKDVEDKEQPPGHAPASANVPPTDVEMANGDSDSASTSSVMAPEPKKPEKPEFKADQHPIFIYRCFILQCLTELLASYNRTKVECINFSRKADPQAATPSKPRSGVLNYLLNALIPVGTLNHADDIPSRKKVATSNWAMSAVVSLCSKTGERGFTKGHEKEAAEEEPELLFVRRFVFEHILKAYKDANASTEPLDLKYSRLLSLADLLNRLLTSKPTAGTTNLSMEMLVASQKQMARIMYEKNFITALTTSIADIDLNFPNSKRAVKYILRPLKLLTQTAIDLSMSSDLSSTLDHTEEDDISTASSVTSVDDDREETPDLWRHSTLGILDPGRGDEDTDSEDGDDEDDEDMYEGEYGDEMDYEDDVAHEHGDDDVVSEEDEEIEGMGPIEGLSGEPGMDVEVIIEGEDDDMTEDEDDSEDDDDDEDEDTDDEDDVEEAEDFGAMEEITGDDENGSLAEGDEEEWGTEEEDGEDYPGQDEIEDESGMPGGGRRPRYLIPMMGGENPHELLERLEGDLGELEMDIEQMDQEYLEDEMQDEEDDEEDEEEYDEEDIVYEPGFEEDDDADGDGMRWPWDNGAHPAGAGRHHAEHHHHRTNPWSLFTGGASDRIIVPPYRAHRPGATTRGNDDGTNPLLQRSGRTGSGPPSGGRGGGISDWVHAIDPMRPGRFSLGAAGGPVSIISNLINAMAHGHPAIQHHHHHGGALHFTIGGFPGGGPGPFGALDGAVRLRRPQEQTARTPRDDPAQAVSFTPTLTVTRWQEQARLLFGTAAFEKAQRVINSILRLLVPPAIEEQKQRAKEAAERSKRMKEELEAAKAKEEAERAEREAKEKKEREEQEAAEREAAAQAEANAQAEQSQETGQEPEATVNTQNMEGVEQTQIPSADATEENTGPSEPTQRITTTLRGRELDITGMGIDLEYLEALPEELREEVLMQQVAEQRSQAAAAGEEPTDISREFLEALPADIREELLQQEAQDRRRREREEARRRAAASGGPPPPGPVDMDAASFLASLDPHLRQAVLMEQDEEMLAQLPREIALEARALGGDRRLNQFQDMPRARRAGELEQPQQSEEWSEKKAKPRPVVQMLDKAGVATLLRLMFIPQQGNTRQSLNGILRDVCENRQNRAEVVSILLSILQDGSADVNAVERSFAQLTLRAKQTPTQKTLQPPKRSSFGQIPINNELSPLMVVQQCLSTLVFLTQYNPHISFFFLTEHETGVGVKSRSNRKGKGKESRASKYPLNALLSLLDRKLIIESSPVMEQLTALLASITQPLNMLLKKDKDQSSGEENKDQQAGEVTAPTGENSTAAEPGTAAATAMTVDSAESTSADPEHTAHEQTTEAEQNDAKASSDKDDKHEKPKKPRMLTPPEVPESNLRLVVNILAARECSSKTFRDTISLISNLSAIPEAREIFGRESIKQAQQLAQSILNDLEDLVNQINKAKTGVDVQGMALAKFSPGSSDQVKLLRMITALDYLFDPKRAETQDKPASSSSAEGLGPERKADILTTLYENSTFGPLWNKLSECLTAVRRRGNMLNVATILLPLIEVLMIVCKNTTLKDAPMTKATQRDFSLSSPPPESRMESLFFTFTEEHRKVLNDLVRQNPKLMSGSFALLVKNSKVLEFDNKRNYFNRKLHSRGTEARHPHQPLQLSVRRDYVFLDSFKSLYFKSRDEMKYGKLSIRFHGEEGVDAGGVTREWFQVLAKQMFNPDYALFNPVAADRTTFHPNPLSAINPEHLMFFKFIGRIIGKALYEGRVLDCHFSRAVYKRILGKPVSIKDMETLDLDYYKSLLWMLENDITDIITETFSVETQAFGETKIVDLIENGRNVPVTEENKHEYVRLVVEYRMIGSVQEQLEHFLSGFHDIVPAELISIFNEQELELLISGLPDIDVDDWKNNTEYHNYTAASPQIQWFWRAVRSFDKEEQAKLLQFVTGTSKVPLNGFKELEGMNGFSRFNVHRDYGSKDRLPSSHTCFNQLDLPEYDSYETLRQQLYTAVTAGSEYFGFA